MKKISYDTAIEIARKKIMDYSHRQPSIYEVGKDYIVVTFAVEVTKEECSEETKERVAG